MSTKHLFYIKKQYMKTKIVYPIYLGLILLSVLISGCFSMPRSYGTIWQRNIAPLYPTMNYSYANRYRTIEDLKPELKWTDIKKTNQTYDLCIWSCDATHKTIPWYGGTSDWGTPIYSANNIAENFHQVKYRLEPNTYYNWSVRIRESGILSPWSSFKQVKSDIVYVEHVENVPFGFKTTDIKPSIYTDAVVTRSQKQPQNKLKSNAEEATQAKSEPDGTSAADTKAIQFKPDDAVAFYNHGNAKRAKGDLDGSIADYSKAIELKPDFAFPYNNRGDAKKAKGDMDGAIADFNKAIELKPDYVFAYNNRGVAKKAKRDIEGAIADFNKAIELNPDYADAYYNRGNASYTKGDLDGAIADYTKAIKLKPDNSAAYKNRGSAKKAKGDLDGANADFRKANELKAGPSR